MFSYQTKQIVPSQNEKIFALVDCSIDERVCKRISRWLNSANHINLFKGTFAAEAEKLSPVLVDLTGTSSDRDESLEDLLSTCEGKPLLSFIWANSTLDQLASHLRQLLTIKTADGQEFFLRYADNRVLPTIFSVFTDAQQDAFLGPIQKWLVATHRADVIMLIPSEGDQERIEAPLQLDERQFAELMEKSEVHFVVSQLEQAYETFKDHFSEADRIQFVEQNAENACSYGFNGLEDRTAWCVAALRIGENFHTHQRVAPILNSVLENHQNLNEALPMLYAEMEGR